VAAVLDLFEWSRCHIHVNLRAPQEVCLAEIADFIEIQLAAARTSREGSKSSASAEAYRITSV
jgi:hypothetical protein